MSAYSGTPTQDYCFDVGDRAGKSWGMRKGVTITISSQGGTSNTIGAVALGFKAGYIWSVILRNYTDGSLQNRGIIVWTNGTNIYLGDPQVSTDADRCEPLDMTGTLALEVFGLPA